MLSSFGQISWHVNLLLFIVFVWGTFCSADALNEQQSTLAVERKHGTCSHEIQRTDAWTMLRGCLMVFALNSTCRNKKLKNCEKNTRAAKKSCAHQTLDFPCIRLCLTGGLQTDGFRNWMTRDVGTSVSARHPDVATYPLARHCLLSGIGKKERSHLDGEWSRMCKHLSSFNVSKPPVRHSLIATSERNKTKGKMQMTYRQFPACTIRRVCH